MDLHLDSMRHKAPAPSVATKMQMFRLVIFFAALAFIGLMSLLPASAVARSSLGGHNEHLLAYAGTAILIATLYRGAFFPLFVGLSAYAAALEYLQGYSPGRVSSVADFVFSEAGLIAGIAVVGAGQKLWLRTTKGN